MKTSIFLLTMLLAVLAPRANGAAAPVAPSRGDPGPAAASAHADRAAASDDRGAVGGASDDADLAGSVLGVRGPTVGAVLTAAYAAAGLDRDPKDSWIWRARLAGLVPWVTVRTTRDASWQDEHSEVGHGSSFEVRATWRLDRLMFDSKELQVAAIEAARRRERRRLAARVIRTYFAWRRAASVATIDDRAATRADEAAAELDALTDGWFSAQLHRPRRVANSPP